MNTDLKPSAICLGTGQLGSTVDKKTSFELLDAFVDMGGNFIDTAHVYADWIPGEKSASEKTIGRWLKERGIRDKVIIGTKGAHPELSTMHIQRLSRDEIVKDLNESLEYLQTDYIDLYWLHRDDPKRPVADILETLNDQVLAGKIRYFGCSNWRPHRIREALEYAQKNGLKAFVANQMMWSYALPNKEGIKDKTLVPMDEEGLELHRQTGMAAIPYSSQAKGFFTKLSISGLEGLSDDMKEVYYNDENMQRFKRAKKIAEEMAISINQVALAYLISQPFTTIPIVGCYTVQKLKDSIGAGDLELDKKTLEYLQNGVSPNCCG